MNSSALFEVKPDTSVFLKTLARLSFSHKSGNGVDKNEELHGT